MEVGRRDALANCAREITFAACSWCAGITMLRFGERIRGWYRISGCVFERCSQTDPVILTPL